MGAQDTWEAFSGSMNSVNSRTKSQSGKTAQSFKAMKVILCSSVLQWEAANGNGFRGLYEMQLGAWVGVQLLGIVSNQGQKTAHCLCLIQTMSSVLANWIEEQFFIIVISNITHKSWLNKCLIQSCVFFFFSPYLCSYFFKLK